MTCPALPGGIYIPLAMAGQFCYQANDQPELVAGYVAPPLIIKHAVMLHAIRGGLTLAVAIVVIQLFLPEIAVRLVELIVKILDLALVAVDHSTATLPS